MENTYLKTEKLSTLMRKYSVPCVISQLAGALYNIVDQIFHQLKEMNQSAVMTHSSDIHIKNRRVCITTTRNNNGKHEYDSPPQAGLAQIVVYECMIHRENDR